MSIELPQPWLPDFKGNKIRDFQGKLHIITFSLVLMYVVMGYDLNIYSVMRNILVQNENLLSQQESSGRYPSCRLFTKQVDSQGCKNLSGRKH